MDKRNPVRVAIITCAYDRPMIFKLFLKWFLFLRQELKVKFDLHLYCGGSADDYFGECKRIFHATVGDFATWVECPNEPLGKKWNDTLLAAKGTPYDYFMILGSDDFPSVSLFHTYYPYIQNEYNYLGLTNFYMMDIDSLQTKLWQGYDVEHRDRTVGGGRFLSSEIILNNNYHLWYDDRNSGLDMSMDKILATTKDIKEKTFSCNNDAPILAIKSEVNLWKYSSFKGIVNNTKDILTTGYNTAFYENILHISKIRKVEESEFDEYNLLRTDETYSLPEKTSNYQATFNSEIKVEPPVIVPPAKPSIIIVKKPLLPLRQWDILIISLRSREKYFNRITKKLQDQINALKLQKEIKIIHRIDDGKLSIGFKRNWCVEQSQAKYICHVDDDDDVHPDYIRELYEATLKNPDSVTFNGTVYFNGDTTNPREFNSNLDYREYTSSDGRFLHPPGHLNPIKREIAIRYKFKEFDKLRDRASDVHHAMDMVNDRALKSAIHINKPLYIYRRRL